MKRLWLACTVLTFGCNGVISAVSPEVDLDNQAELDDGSDGTDLDSVSCNAEQGFAAGPRVIRRLSRIELDNTVGDLLAVPSSHGESLPADIIERGFDNQAEVLSVSTLFAEKWFFAASDLADYVVTERGINDTMGCTATQNNCQESFVESFGLRAFRRPLTDTEISDYRALFQDVEAAEGLRRVLTAMLVSPFFLYRIEVGDEVEPGRYVLTDYEIASELSYTFWGTMPDAELFDAAARGDLRDSEKRRSQAERLLDHSNAQNNLLHFFLQWLDVEEVTTKFKEDTSFDDAARQAALEEYETLVLDAMATGSFKDLMAGPLDDSRYGVLGTTAFLAAHSATTPDAHLTPILRGEAVSEFLLCTPVPDPPPDVPTEIPDIDPDATPMERLAQHRVDPACSYCHVRLDPIGGPFEYYDELGGYREQYDNGKDVDGSGQLHVDGDVLQGPQAMAQAVADDAHAQQCFAERVAEFSMGVDVEASAECIDAEAPLKNLWLALAASEHFVERQSDAGEPGVGSCEGTVDPPADPDPGTDPDPDPGPDPDPDNGLPNELVIDYSIPNDWGAGYSGRVSLLNNTDAPITWEVTLEVEGDIQNLYSASVLSSEGETTTFVGADYNNVLQPGESTEFGWNGYR